MNGPILPTMMLICLSDEYHYLLSVLDSFKDGNDFIEGTPAAPRIMVLPLEIYAFNATVTHNAWNNGIQSKTVSTITYCDLPDRKVWSAFISQQAIFALAKIRI